MQSPWRKRLPALPEELQRVFSFGVYAVSYVLPEEERTTEMVRGLEWFIEELHGAGYAAPRWLQKPYWYFRSKSRAARPEYRKGPTNFLMRGLLDDLVQHLPPYERWDAIREHLRLCVCFYAEADTPPPEWLREAMEEFEMGELDPRRAGRAAEAKRGPYFGPRFFLGDFFTSSGQPSCGFFT